jgi:hypothetical protein
MRRSGNFANSIETREIVVVEKSPRDFPVGGKLRERAQAKAAIVY